MRGSTFSADMHNYIWCPIYIPSFMIIGSVVSKELRWPDFGTDGQPDGRSDPTPRHAIAFSDAGKEILNKDFQRLILVVLSISRGIFFAFRLPKVLKFKIVLALRKTLSLFSKFWILLWILSKKWKRRLYLFSVWYRLTSFLVHFLINLLI